MGDWVRDGVPLLLALGAHNGYMAGSVVVPFFVALGKGLSDDDS